MFISTYQPKEVKHELSPVAAKRYTVIFDRACPSKHERLDLSCSGEKIICMDCGREWSVVMPPAGKIIPAKITLDNCTLSY